MSFTAIPGSYTSNGRKMIPRNCLWLDTKYWSFFWIFNEVPINYSFESERFTVAQLDCKFYFRINKTSSTVFSVELHRVLKDPNERPDDGFVLHLIWSVVGLHRIPEDKYMNSSTDRLLISYDISNLDLDEPVVWIVKCGFEMCEFTSLDNEASRKQNKLLIEMIKSKKSMPKNLSFIAYLLNSSQFDSIFSGRQSYKFAMGKVKLIERSVDFAECIVGHILDEAAATPPLNPSQRRLLQRAALGYIYGNEPRNVKDSEVLILCGIAFHYGLLALKRQCMDYLKNCLGDTDFLLSVLVFCDVRCVNSSLMSAALAEFVNRKEEIRRSDKLKHLLATDMEIMRSITNTLVCEKMRKAYRLKKSSLGQTEAPKEDPSKMEMSM